MFSRSFSSASAGFLRLHRVTKGDLLGTPKPLMLLVHAWQHVGSLGRDRSAAPLRFHPRWSWCSLLPAFLFSCHVQLQPQLDGLSAVCNDVSGGKRASLAAMPSPLTPGTHQSSPTPQGDGGGQWQSAEKQRVPERLRQRLPCYLERSVCA